MMRIEGHLRTWDAIDEAALEQVLRFRDRFGGGQFWLAHDDRLYPVVALRISGDVADVTYFPLEGHPGFRALASTSTETDDDDTTILIYEGCDPSSGEECPNEFVLPVDTAVALAREFCRTGKQPTGASWFEL